MGSLPLPLPLPPAPGHDTRSPMPPPPRTQRRQTGQARASSPAAAAAPCASCASSGARRSRVADGRSPTSALGRDVFDPCFCFSPIVFFSVLLFLFVSRVSLFLVLRCCRFFPFVSTFCWCLYFYWLIIQFFLFLGGGEVWRIRCFFFSPFFLLGLVPCLVGWLVGWPHPQHHQLLALISWQLGVAAGWFKLGGLLLGGLKVDFEWVWVGLELICVRCAAGLAAALGLLWCG